jgi:hypothetical protein
MGITSYVITRALNLHPLESSIKSYDHIPDLLLANILGNSLLCLQEDYSPPL